LDAFSYGSAGHFVNADLKEISSLSKKGYGLHLPGFEPSIFPMLTYPDPARFWKSSAALERTRSLALDHGRRELAKRRSSGGLDVLGNSTVHMGYQHVDFFRDQFPQLLQQCPPAFRAVELGAGMGWHACMLAAGSSGSVLATDVIWERKSPHNRYNVSALRRLAERDSRLRSVLTFDDAGERVRFDKRIQFAGAPAEKLPVRTSAVDLVYSVNCVEHMRDVNGCFSEGARVLKVGGLMFGSTEPLYFSMQGHHLDDYFPIPWGHLLWPAEELADLVFCEGGKGREWTPGEPLKKEHLFQVLTNDLNYAAPSDIRRAVLPGPWRVRGWVDLVLPEAEAVARRIRLRDAIPTVSRESLLLHGLRFLLERCSHPTGLRIPLRLPWTTRRFLQTATLRRLRGRS
jgi:SAM-dependent methyltransferase